MTDQYDSTSLAATRPALPPVEAGRGLAPAPAQQQSEQSTGVSNWVHKNRWFTKEPISYVGYQFFRSSIAAIPYGFAMSLGHHLFGLMSVKGQKMGLTDKGIKVFSEQGGLAAVEKAAAEAQKTLGHANEFYKVGHEAVVGRNMMRLGNSPLNAAFQIAMGFTLFRFTGGIIKNVRDRVMNEKNTEQDTKREVRHMWGTVKETAKTNWPAESTGTPIAALVLGFMNAAFTPSVAPIRDKVKHPGLKGFGAQVKEVWSPKSKLLQNAAVWTLSYSLFFLLAESLFKDVQIRRGLWKGHPNSLKNGPDDTVGGPAAPDFKTPENDPAVNNYSHKHTGKKEDDRAQATDTKLKYPGLTGEPSWGRFAFRRVLPVAVGISAYAALKRVGYLGAGGPMKAMTVGEVDKLKTFGDHAKFYLENARREGLATTMFGALWVAADAGGSWYDKITHQIQKPENAVPLTDKQQRNHAALLERLNAKELGEGRAA